MKTAEAIKIFKDLNNQEYTMLEKVESVVEVLNMPTHNSITKANLLAGLHFMTEVAQQLVVAKEAAQQQAETK